MNVFLINLFPFNLDKWAPRKPPVKEPTINIIKIFEDNEPILARKIPPIRFQKIPTVKKVKLIARMKSIPKVFIKSIVTSNPVPEEIEPFKIPIKKIKSKSNFLNKLVHFYRWQPNSDFKMNKMLILLKWSPKISIKPFWYKFKNRSSKITPGEPKIKFAKQYLYHFQGIYNFLKNLLS